MQKTGVCYRKRLQKEEWRKRMDLRLRPNGRHNPGVVLHYFLTELDRSLLRRALCRRVPAVLNGRFETCQKHLARRASVEVLFQFITQRIVQLLIEIVREL